MRLLIIVALIAAIPLVSCSGPQESSSHEHGGEEHVELAGRMATLQQFTQKMMLAVQARNRELSRFYLHEMEETTAGIAEEVPEYEGHPIGKLTRSMLLGPVEKLHEAWPEMSWSEIDRAVDQTIRQCNACHASTEHGFVVIPDTARTNPFLQSFAPRDG